MYTELIFGAMLKEDTPKEVIDDLKIMEGGDLEQVSKEVKDFKYVLRTSSYYFGVCEPVRRMWFDDISQQWVLSSRSSIKNYGEEIQQFLKWISPYIAQGSGEKDFYAIVTYEEAEEPTIYYLRDSC